MNLKTGNLWSQAGVLIVTGNSYLRKDGALVMGRGAALEAKTRYPGIDQRFGLQISNLCGSGGFYGLLFDKVTGMGLFQVKRHFRDEATLELITNSARRLKLHANRNLNELFSLNFPGIGAGGLRRHKGTILSILSSLPDNVTVMQLPKVSV
jgi:hypothetical protein